MVARTAERPFELVPVDYPGLTLVLTRTAADARALLAALRPAGAPSWSARPLVDSETATHTAFLAASAAGVGSLAGGRPETTDRVANRLITGHLGRQVKADVDHPQHLVASVHPRQRRRP